MENENKIPDSLQEAIETLIEGNKAQLEDIITLSEDEFLGHAHHGLGRNLRNNWYLWWQEKFAKEDLKYPQERPALNAYFHSLNIVHGDDMSGIILSSFHRQISGKPIELEKQIEHYLDYWKSKGFKDGITNMKKATYKICPQCGKKLNSLGYARHMTMHRDKNKLKIRSASKP